MLITQATPKLRGQWTPPGPLFVAYSTMREKDILKDAGFRWDRELQVPGDFKRGYWYTHDPAIAARLAPYADEATVPLVREYAEARKESRLTDADIELPVPPGLAYLPFQRAGIAYALDRSSVLFADEMGLGKTIQAIGVMNADPPKRTLVVCPASLKANWRRELTRWLVDPLLTVGIARSDFFPPAAVVIINYDILDKHAELIQSMPWDLLIVDECHFIKNPKARRSKCILGGDPTVRGDRDAYPGIRAARRLFLTGTPIVNRPAELYPLLHNLDPDRWKKKADFAWRYCKAGDKNAGRNLPELQDILRSTVMVRRLKADVMTELPPKRRQILELPATTEQRRRIAEEFSAIRDAGVTDGDWSAVVAQLMDGGGAAGFEELSRIRHETALIKAPSVASHVRDLLEEVPKVVLFAHHLDVLTLLHSALADDFGAVLFTGETPMDERQRLVDRFQNSDSCRVFVASITAAGVGITLTASNTVVFAELDWVPGNMKQAEDRCHRIGSEVHESILIQHVVLEESLDVYMAQVMSEKLATIERALDRETKPIEATKTVRAEAPAGSLAGGKPAVRERTDADYPELPGGIAQCRALKRVAQILAGNDPDYAGEENGIGFNRMDTTIGHSLADWPGDFTPKQAMAALKIFFKYHRQIPADLAELAFAKG